MNSLGSTYSEAGFLRPPLSTSNSAKIISIVQLPKATPKKVGCKNCKDLEKKLDKVENDLRLLKREHAKLKQKHAGA